MKGVTNLGTRPNSTTTATNAMRNVPFSILYSEIFNEIPILVSKISDSLSLIKEVQPMCPSSLLWSSWWWNPPLYLRSVSSHIISVPLSLSQSISNDIQCYDISYTLNDVPLSVFEGSVPSLCLECTLFILEMGPFSCTNFLRQCILSLSQLYLSI